MIQRIQTVYLFVALLLNATVFFNALYSHAMEDPQAWIGVGFAVVLTMACIMSLSSIFLYRNRITQMVWVKRTAWVQIIVFGWSLGILFSLGGFGVFLWDETLGAGILLLALLSQLMAYRNIKKDEELVQSMDRIR